MSGTIAYALERIGVEEMSALKRCVPAGAFPSVYCVAPGNLEVWPPLPGGWRLDWVDDAGQRLVAIDDAGIG